MNHNKLRKSILIKKLEKDNHKNLVGCVIGVGRGSDILIMHKFLNIRMLYLIDPYVPMKFRETTGVNDNYVKLKPEAMVLMDEYKDTTFFIEGWAQKVADRVPDGLDFVWIDILGIYENIIEVLRAYYPKVKKNGFFSGKGYDDNWPGFRRALDDFEKEQKIVVNKIVNKDNVDNGDWWVDKK